MKRNVYIEIRDILRRKLLNLTTLIGKYETYDKKEKLNYLVKEIRIKVKTYIQNKDFKI